MAPARARGFRWPRLRFRRRPAPALPPAPVSNGDPPARRSTTDQLAAARRRAAAVRLPLDDSFRYVHHPFAAEEDGLPLLGNEEAVLATVERILHSNGGAFLLTGFRGVGKTTVVLDACSTSLRLRTATAGSLVPIIAQRRAADERRTSCSSRWCAGCSRRSSTAACSNGSSPDVQRAAARLVYTRTSLAFQETRENSVERALESRPSGLGGVGGPVFGKLAPKPPLLAQGDETRWRRRRRS